VKVFISLMAIFVGADKKKEKDLSHIKYYWYIISLKRLIDISGLQKRI
jgi:hypothetical protein